MHLSTIKLKDGTVQTNPIYKWNPKEGTVQLFDYPSVNLTDVESGTIGGHGRKIVNGKVKPVEVDMLTAAREDGWDGS
jgi:hypothetical protein